MPNVGTASVDIDVDGPLLGRNIRSAVNSQSGGISSAFGAIGRKGADALSAGFSGAVRLVERVGLAAGVAGVALGGFGLKLAGDFQQTRIAFEGILGSAEKAQTFLTTLRDFAAKTPFEFPELAAAAKQLLAVGFNASDVIPIMTKLGNVAATLGVGGEAINGVVRALGQMKGKGKASAEELNQISEQIPGFSAVKAIAEKMGVSTADAFKAMEKGAVSADFAIEAILEGMERFPGAAGAMDRQSKTLNGVISTLKDTFKNALIDGIEPFLPAIASGLEKSAPLIQRTVTGVVGVIRTAVSGVSGAIHDLRSGFAEGLVDDGVFNRVGDAFRRLVAGFKEAWPQVKETISGIAATITEGLGAAVGWVREHWPEIRTIIVDAVSTIRDVVAGVVDSVQTVWANFGEQIMAWTGGHWEGVKTTISGALEFIRGITETVTAILHADWADAWDGIKAIFSGAWDFLSGGQEMFNAAFASAVSAGMEVVGSAFSAAWEGIKSGMSTAFDWMVGFVTELPGRILGGLGDLSGLLYEAGKDLIRGMINGVRDMVGGLIDAAKGVVGSAVNATKSALGIGSPSRVFMVIGQQTAEGFIVGLDKSQPAITSAVTHILDVAETAAYDAMKGLDPGGANAIYGPTGRRITGEVRSPFDGSWIGFYGYRQEGDGGYIITEANLAGQAEDIYYPPGWINSENFREYHNGGIVGGNWNSDVPIVAQGGEGVFTREQMAAMGGTMSDATIEKLAVALAAAIAANPPQITASSIARGQAQLAARYR